MSALSHITEVTAGLASTSQLRLRLPTPASRTSLVTLEMLTVGTSEDREDVNDQSSNISDMFALVRLTGHDASAV